MSSAQSNIEILDKILKSTSIAALLYPLDRVQSIKQIQSTYSNTSIRQHTSILSLSIHHGVSSYFRGLMSFLTKTTILTAAAKVSQLAFSHQNIDQNMKKLLFFGFSTLGYLLTYPLEIVNIRMGAQIEGQRFYSTIKQCLSKIKKNEGYRTMFRGFPLSYSIFLMQMFSTHYILSSSQQKSQWHTILTIFGLINLSQMLFYPLVSLKKIIQINGAIGHSDSNYSLGMALRRNNWLSLWRGCELKLVNLLLYTLMSCSYVGSK